MAATITITRNGPLVVEGEFALVDRNGDAFGLEGRTRISLCRCGHSSNKPFCDGSHKGCGFEDAGYARDHTPPK